MAFTGPIQGGSPPLPSSQPTPPLASPLASLQQSAQELLGQPAPGPSSYVNKFTPTQGVPSSQMWAPGPRSNEYDEYLRLAAQDILGEGKAPGIDIPNYAQLAGTPKMTKRNVRKKKPALDDMSMILDRIPPKVSQNPINYVKQFRSQADNPDVEHLHPSTMSAATNLFQQLQARGYRPEITSGKRGGGGKSWHDHGKAIDINIYDKDGNLITYNVPDEVRRLAAEAGFRGFIDEANHPIPGVSSGPHFHLSMAPEGGIDLAQYKRGSKKELPSDYVQYSKKGKHQLSEDYAYDLIRGVGSSNPHLILEQLKAESGLRAYDNQGRILASRDRAGNPIAYGVGQFTQGTLEAVAAKHGFTPKQYMENPAVQVKLAALYMNDLTEKYNGSHAKALFAYNAGEGALDDFLKGKGGIPAETRGYISKIMTAYGQPVKPSEVDELIRSGRGDVLQDKQRSAKMLMQEREEAAKEAVSFASTLSRAKDNINEYAGGDILEMGRETIQGMTFGLSQLVPGLKPTGRFDSLREGKGLFSPERLSLGLPWFLGNVLTTELAASALGVRSLLTNQNLLGKATPVAALETGPLAEGVRKTVFNRITEPLFSFVADPKNKVGPLRGFARLFTGTSPEFAQSILAYSAIAGMQGVMETGAEIVSKEGLGALPSRMGEVLSAGVGYAGAAIAFGFGIPAFVGGAATAAGVGVLGAKSAPTIARTVAEHLYGPVESTSELLLRKGQQATVGAIAGGAAGAVGGTAAQAMGYQADPNTPLFMAGGALGAMAGGPAARAILRHVSPAEAAAHAIANAESISQLGKSTDKGIMGSLADGFQKFFDSLAERPKNLLKAAVNDNIGKYMASHSVIAAENDYNMSLSHMAKVQEDTTKATGFLAQQVSEKKQQLNQLAIERQKAVQEIQAIPNGEMLYRLESQYRMLDSERTAMLADPSKKTQVDSLTKSLELLKAQKDSVAKAMESSAPTVTSPRDAAGVLSNSDKYQAAVSKIMSLDQTLNNFRSTMGPNFEMMTEAERTLEGMNSIASFHQQVHAWMSKPEVKEQMVKNAPSRWGRTLDLLPEQEAKIASLVDSSPVKTFTMVPTSSEQSAVMDHVRDIMEESIKDVLRGKPILAPQAENLAKLGLHSLSGESGVKPLLSVLHNAKEHLESALAAVEKQESLPWVHGNKWNGDANAITRARWAPFAGAKTRQVVWTDPRVVRDMLNLKGSDGGQLVTEMKARMDSGKTLDPVYLSLSKGKVVLHGKNADKSVASLLAAVEMGETHIPISIPKDEGMSRDIFKAANKVYPNTREEVLQTITRSLKDVAEHYSILDPARLKLDYPGIGVIDDAMDLSPGTIRERLYKQTAYDEAAEKFVARSDAPNPEAAEAMASAMNDLHNSLQEALEVAKGSAPRYTEREVVTQVPDPNWTPPAEVIEPDVPSVAPPAKPKKSRVKQIEAEEAKKHTVTVKEVLKATKQGNDNALPLGNKVSSLLRDLIQGFGPRSAAGKVLKKSLDSIEEASSHLVSLEEDVNRAASHREELVKAYKEATTSESSKVPVVPEKPVNRFTEIDNLAKKQAAVDKEVIPDDLHRKYEVLYRRNQYTPPDVRNHGQQKRAILITGARDNGHTPYSNVLDVQENKLKWRERNSKKAKAREKIIALKQNEKDKQRMADAIRENWRGQLGIHYYLDQIAVELGGVDFVIHGGAKGTDTVAGEWALTRGLNVEVMPADFKGFEGAAAGMNRNLEMIALAKDYVRAGYEVVTVAFPGRDTPISSYTNDKMASTAESGLYTNVFELHSVPENSGTYHAIKEALDQKLRVKVVDGVANFNPAEHDLGGWDPSKPLYVKARDEGLTVSPELAAASGEERLPYVEYTRRKDPPGAITSYKGKHSFLADWEGGPVWLEGINQFLLTPIKGASEKPIQAKSVAHAYWIARLAAGGKMADARKAAGMYKWQDAKEFSLRVLPNDPENWDPQKAMKGLLVKKFSKPEMQRKLLAETGDTPIGGYYGEFLTELRDRIKAKQPSPIVVKSEGSATTVSSSVVKAVESLDNFEKSLDLIQARKNSKFPADYPDTWKEAAEKATEILASAVPEESAEIGFYFHAARAKRLWGALYDRENYRGDIARDGEILRGDLAALHYGARSNGFKAPHPDLLDISDKSVLTGLYGELDRYVKNKNVRLTDYHGKIDSWLTPTILASAPKTRALVNYQLKAKMWKQLGDRLAKLESVPGNVDKIKSDFLTRAQTRGVRIDQLPEEKTIINALFKRLGEIVDKGELDRLEKVTPWLKETVGKLLKKELVAFLKSAEGEAAKGTKVRPAFSAVSEKDLASISESLIPPSVGKATTPRPSVSETLSQNKIASPAVAELVEKGKAASANLRESTKLLADSQTAFLQHLRDTVMPQLQEYLQGKYIKELPTETAPVAAAPKRKKTSSAPPPTAPMIDVTTKERVLQPGTLPNINAIRAAKAAINALKNYDNSWGVFNQLHDHMRNTMDSTTFDRLFLDELKMLASIGKNYDQASYIVAQRLSSVLGNTLDSIAKDSDAPVLQFGSLDRQASTAFSDYAQAMSVGRGMNFLDVRTFTEGAFENHQEFVSKAWNVVADSVSKNFKDIEKDMGTAEKELFRKVLNRPDKAAEILRKNPEMSNKLGTFYDLLGKIQKMEAYSPEVIPIAERNYMIARFPGLASYIRSLEGRPSNLQELLNLVAKYDDEFSNIAQQRFHREFIGGTERRAFGSASPDLYHDSQINWRIDEALGKIDPNKVEQRTGKPYKAPQGVLEKKYTMEDFLHAKDDETRAKMAGISGWFSQDPANATARLREMQALFLMKGAVQDPSTLLGMRLRAVMHAHAEQQFLRGMEVSLVDPGPIQGAVERVPTPLLWVKSKNPGQSVPVSMSRFRKDLIKQSKSTSKSLVGKIRDWVSPKFEGEGSPYLSADKVYGDAFVYIDQTGKSYKASDVYLHPDTFDFLHNYSQIKTPEDHSVFWNQVRNAIRQLTLMGSPIPHALNLTSNLMVHNAMNPIKAFGLMGKGFEMMEGQQKYLLMANAIRHGVSSGIQRNLTQTLADSLMEDMDQGMREAIPGTSLFDPFKYSASEKELAKGTSSYSTGVGKTGLQRFVQAADYYDPHHKEAMASLNPAVQQLVGSLGTMARLDHLMSRAMIVEPIQAAQVASFYYHSAEIFQRNLHNLGDMSREAAWSWAQKAAAEKVNLAAGALPYYRMSNSTRNSVWKNVLTPSWAYAKAQQVIQGLEGVLGLTTGKKGTRFGYMPEAFRKSIQAEYAAALTMGTLGFLGATEVMQFMISGTRPTDSPNPQDWFRVKIGDHVYSNPLYGFYRDFARTVGGVIGEQSVVPILQTLSRQLMPASVPGFGLKVAGIATSGAAEGDMPPSGLGAQAGYVSKSFIDSIVNTEEFMGGGRASDLMSVFGIDYEGKPADRMRSREWVLRTMGVYRSDWNTPVIMDRRYEKEVLAAQKAAKRDAATMIQASLDTADPEKAKEYLGRAYEAAVLRGYSTNGKLTSWLKTKNGDGRMRMSHEQFMNILMRKVNPSLYGASLADKRRATGIYEPLMKELNRVNQSWEDAASQAFKFGPNSVNQQTTNLGPASFGDPSFDEENYEISDSGP